jgi:hypothetical protein
VILLSASNKHREWYVLDILFFVDLSLTDAESPDDSSISLCLQLLDQGRGELLEASRVFC